MAEIGTIGLLDFYQRKGKQQPSKQSPIVMRKIFM